MAAGRPSPAHGTPPVGPDGSAGLPARTRTRSAEIVAEIEQEIVERGWPIGELLGSEAQLMRRFGVSRAVLREAIRTLESAGIVHVRTGRSGGLVVAAPDVATVRAAASLYLDFVGLEPRALYDAWRVIEGGVIDLVVEAATDEELAQLCELQRDDARRGIEGLERSTYRPALARLTHNPVVELFFQMLGDVLMVHGRDTSERSARWFARQHGRMATAMAARDAATARQILSQYLDRLEATESVLARRRRRPSAV